MVKNKGVRLNIEPIKKWSESVGGHNQAVARLMALTNASSTVCEQILRGRYLSIPSTPIMLALSELTRVPVSELLKESAS